MTDDVKELLQRLARRDDPRTEATVQSDVRQLLLRPELGLSDAVVLETQVGDRRRIDVELGTTVIEVKKHLGNPKVREDARQQLAGYVRSRTETHGTRYAGILTDGCEWLCFDLEGKDFRQVSRFELSPTRPDLDRLLLWIEGVLATAQKIPPTPEQVSSRLGAGSSEHDLERARLAALFAAHRDSAEVRTRRRLWARLLETALGSQFEDTDELFIEHTLLVNMADIIAHAVLGLELNDVDPRALLSGEQFHASEIHGVVEPDFFDWVVDVPEGEEFIRALARRIARFEWGAVEHDILKVLYESVIGTDVRKKLGEYYTPDWLAEKVVEKAVPNPLDSRVLDPSCGSGTFLFHAVRRFVASGRAAKLDVGELLERLTRSVAGMDLHPVAVSLARVTYLLAIGTTLLKDSGRGRVDVPVFLGDSLQWRQRDDLFRKNELSVPINDSGQLFTTEKAAFRFPNSVLEDAQQFDGLIGELARMAADRKPGTTPSITGTLKRFPVSKDVRAAIEEVFATLCRLHDEGRDHIWGYYIRNLARPVWLNRNENKVDVLVGNPPWLAYRFMPGPMQEDFRSFSETRGLWHGAKVATHQDLSGLFVVRAMERYLRPGGRFAFVLPSAVLDRQQFEGFRSGSYGTFVSAVRATFDPPWDLREIRPHFFPITASVVFGRLSTNPRALPPTGEVWSGQFPKGNASWDVVAPLVTRSAPVVATAPSGPASEYADEFHQGATLVPRVLVMVNEVDPGPLGKAATKTKVESARSANEKAPWKRVSSLQGVVETEFLYRVHLGETILPFRALAARRALLPISSRGQAHPGSDRMGRYPGLSKWWDKSVELWEKHRSSERLTLFERLDYHRELTSQFPIPSAQRVVYSKAGMHLAAARLHDSRAVIDHKLYWSVVRSKEEAWYLLSILNSALVTKLVRPLMSYGKDERDIDKYVWRLPIPLFDPDKKAHAKLAELGGQAEKEIGALTLDEQHFAAMRRAVREWLAESEVGQRIEEAVGKLLPRS